MRFIAYAKKTTCWRELPHHPWICHRHRLKSV